MITTDITPDLVRGAAQLEPGERGLRVHRLPGWVRQQFPDPLLMDREGQPAGVRLVFATSADRVELVTHASRVAYRGVERPRGALDVLVDGDLSLQHVLEGGDVTEVDLATGETTTVPGPHDHTVLRLPAGEHVVEMWLPHNETIELLTLRSDAPLHAVPSSAPRWLHHGSSISHGSGAASPTGTWPVVAARLAGVELRNLGFGGSAMVDPFMARVIRDTEADVISLKLGINVVNADAMRLRAFVPAVHGFLDTIRDGHPETPVLLVSPIYCGIHEQVPGPGSFDPASFGTGQIRFTATGDPAEVARGGLNLEVIRRELAAVVKRRDDRHLHHLDGLQLYGPADAEELPLPDALHPGPEAHQRIGERFAAAAFGAGGPFAAAAGRRAGGLLTS